MTNMIVTTSKEDLLARLKENREKHEKEFTEAMVGWHTAVHDKLALVVKAAKEGEIPELDARSAVDILTDEPVSHVDDYDTAIEMLEWHKGEEMKIAQEQFKMFILDQWRWKESFHSNSRKYR